MTGAAISTGSDPLIWDKRDLKFAAHWIASEPEATREAFLQNLGEDALRALPFLFEFWALEHQLPPDGHWRSWVVLGGRGAGKTRAGAEWGRSMVEGDGPTDPGRAQRVALVGETVDQVREVMIYGESGILSCTPPDRRPVYVASRKRLEWPNGAVAHVQTAFNPEGLRGPQFDAAWVDEFGCAALDRGTNQPNKFIDPKSSESRLPRYSTGARDGLIQKQYYKAMLSYWDDPAHNPQATEYEGRMIDMSRAFAWAWDTRPYPFFPNLEELWSDGDNYPRGHWLTGRASSRSLASVVAGICDRAGVASYDVSALYGYVRGYVAGDVGEARAALEPLMLRFGFDGIERDGTLVFRMRDGLNPVEIDPAWVAVDADQEGLITRTKDAEAELAGRVRLRFVEADADFDVVVEEAILPDEATHAVATSELSMALTRGEGRGITERWLSEARVARDSVSFALPPSRVDVRAGDTIALPTEDGEVREIYRVDRVEQGPHQVIEAVRIAPSIYQQVDLQETLARKSVQPGPVPVSAFFMDL
ncbi:MAG: glycoside hydrolase TIM-barrel-like domain-containing protein, partial [Rhodobacteraceae bacterium]|nr:glycoside hydrolase TIM-barrel-like domain-containing protein [Paracoccaceae bacterium]